MAPSRLGVATVRRSGGDRGARSPRVGTIEELTGRGERGLARGRAPTAEHRADLPDLILAVEPDDLRHGPAAAFALRDPEVGVRVGGDLRQVRHAEHLVAAAEEPQAAADRIGAPAADPGVDLV